MMEIANQRNTIDLKKIASDSSITNCANPFGLASSENCLLKGDFQIHCDEVKQEEKRHQQQ